MTGIGRITLGILLDSLGAETLSPLSLPPGLDVLLGAPFIYDPEDPLGELDGAVLLVAGRASVDLVSRAVRAGVSAVVVKPDQSETAALIEAAQAGRIALLGANPRVAWGHLYVLIDALLAVAAPASHLDASPNVDLFTLANEIALHVGGAVTIEDLAMRVLAYSTIDGQRIDSLREAGILGRRVPAHPSHIEEYASVLRSQSAVWSYEPREYCPRLAIAVRARGEALGTIWVLQSDQPLVADAADVLARAAAAAAPHLARISLAADQGRRRRDEWLGWLLRGDGNPDEVAMSLGLVPDQPLTVIAFGSRERDDDAVDARHATNLIATAYSAYRLQAAAGIVDGRAYAVVDGRTPSSLIERVTGDTLAHISARLGGSWLAGIGRTAASAASVPISAGQARQALQALRGPYTDSQIGRHDRLSAAVLLVEIDSALRGRPTLFSEPLSLIAGQDQNHGTQYLASLRTWIAKHYDVSQAAAALSLHPNTLRYRLRRIGELVDLEDPDIRLVLALQLRISGATNSGT